MGLMGLMGDSFIPDILDPHCAELFPLSERDVPAPVRYGRHYTRSAFPRFWSLIQHNVFQFYNHFGHLHADSGHPCPSRSRGKLGLVGPVGQVGQVGHSGHMPRTFWTSLSQSSQSFPAQPHPIGHMFSAPALRDFGVPFSTTYFSFITILDTFHADSGHPCPSRSCGNSDWSDLSDQSDILDTPRIIPIIPIIPISCFFGLQPRP